MQQNNITDKTASAHKTDEIMVYEHPFFGKIRVFVRYGKIWFCGLDAASSLQYSNPLKAPPVFFMFILTFTGDAFLFDVTLGDLTLTLITFFTIYCLF